MDLTEYNRQAWDFQVESGNEWTQPVSSAEIEAARKGKWQVLLTQNKPVPAHWFPPLANLRLLALASGGGQQAPIFAAAGAKVTLLDNSPKQLAQDAVVASRENLSIKTELGTMLDLTRFEPESFDLVFNPCSIGFVADPETVWQQVARVLRPGGIFLTGFTHPSIYMFDEDDAMAGKVTVRHVHPYSDLTHLTAHELAALQSRQEPFLHGHSLTTLLGGQARAGLALRDLYEDSWGERAFDCYTPAFIATNSIKL